MEEAFKIDRESLQNSLKDHVKNSNDICRLSKEKSQKIKELKASIIGIETSLRQRDATLAKKEIVGWSWGQGEVRTFHILQGRNPVQLHLDQMLLAVFEGDVYQRQGQ